MEIWGLVIASLALSAGIGFGIYHIILAERNKDKLGAALIDVKTQLGDSFSEDLTKLAEVTLSAIEKNGEMTNQSIKIDGAETRSAILAIHKSIKEELGK